MYTYWFSISGLQLFDWEFSYQLFPVLNYICPCILFAFYFKLQLKALENLALVHFDTDGEIVIMKDFISGRDNDKLNLVSKSELYNLPLQSVIVWWNLICRKCVSFILNIFFSL